MCGALRVVAFFASLGPMSFEARQDARKRTIEHVKLAAQVLAAGYMALHIAVTALAYKLAGVTEAVFTFMTLGFGDLYWAVRWFAQEAQGTSALVAAAAAGSCFTSWIARPFFNRWINGFTSGMLSDTAEEIDRIIANSDGPGDTTQQDGEAQDVADEPPDGSHSNSAPPQASEDRR